MESLILVLHVVVCVLLVILVLLQAGKEGMGVIFGGGNTSVFGSSGAGSLLAKMTAFVAVVFVMTSLAYTYVTSEHVTDESAVLSVRIEEPAPAASAPAPDQAAPAAPAAAADQSQGPALSAPADKAKEPAQAAPADAKKSAPAQPAPAPKGR